MGSPPEADVRSARRLMEAKGMMLGELRRVIVGQDEVIEQLLTCFFARGHCLLVGVPGLAKTLLVSSLSRILDLEFRRIQFTPDLMPSDITGSDILQEDPSTRQRVFQFVPGPVFANVILADEINRTPPKTQSALLQAMQEYQVTCSGKTRPLPLPFFVLATQNPIEQEGTYPLPEAQLDRFLMQVAIGYPSRDEELRIVSETTGCKEARLKTVLSASDIVELQGVVRKVPVPDSALEVAVRLARMTRPGAEGAPDFVSQWVAWGAGPRASQSLILGAKARALFEGRFGVCEEDVLKSAKPILRHRLVLNFHAEADGIRPDNVIDRLLKSL